MRLIESHVKFRLLTEEETKQAYENPPNGLQVMRGGVILEGEVWATPAEFADPKFVERAQHNIRQQIVKTIKQAMK